MIIDSIKKDGRPKKPEKLKESHSITVYLNEENLDKIQLQARMEKYKSLSRFVKEKILIRIDHETELHRRLIYEAETYKGLLRELLPHIEEIGIQRQNFLLPPEMVKIAKRIEYFAPMIQDAL
jgi:hypothetical protein